MILLKTSLVLALMVCGTLQQDATFKCESDLSFRYSVFGSSYYDRSTRYRCTYQNVKRFEDLALAQKSSAINSAAFVNQRVNSIIFLNSSLSQLPEKMFASFTGIRTLDASRLVLDSISTTAFFGTHSWDIIDLSNNNIKELNARTFASLTIKHLDLSMNLLEKIDEKAFISADIEKLNLAFNHLKSIKFLNSFSYFNLVELNDNWLENFEELEVKVDGWTTHRTLFPGDFEYPKFFLQNNKFKSVDCVSSIRINSLTLDNNLLLSDISTNQCAIDEIDVSNCGTLKKVSFNDNLLGFTAKNVNLGSVEMLGGKFITTLSLSNSSLPRSLFDKIVTFEKLTFLDLSYTNIGPLNISTFAKLKELEFLHLKATNITNIQFGTFSHQHSVKQFDISDNHLGFFDMNMIFSMNSLLSLDISGNDLTSLENVDSAHFTFTLLQKIDLSNNKWPCNYLMRLIKIFRVYKVVLTSSNLEESGTNIHGISCVHLEGDDDIIEPLSHDSTNITDVREKMNEMINEVAKNSQYRGSVESRLRQLENKVDNQLDNSVAFSTALHSEKNNIEVKNSALLETVMLIACISVVVFISMKTFVYLKRNFFARSRQVRSSSERTLSMTVDDF